MRLFQPKNSPSQNYDFLILYYSLHECFGLMSHSFASKLTHTVLENQERKQIRTEEMSAWSMAGSAPSDMGATCCLAELCVS